MNVRERILTIRLMEKLGNHLEYAAQLGIQIPTKDDSVLAKQTEAKSD
jgi:hypothetical protein